MNKKFLNAILFGALALSTATFTGCKDYDDDINDLWSEVDKKATADELISQIAAVQTSLDGAKADAAKALSDAQKGISDAAAALAKANGADSNAATAKTAADAAKTAADAAKTAADNAQTTADAAKTIGESAKTIAEAAQTAAAAAQAAADAAKTDAAAAAAEAAVAKADAAAAAAAATQAKTDAIADAATKVAALRTELTGLIDAKASQADFDALALRVDAVEGSIIQLLGHRLTSITVIPDTHINGIAAIKLKTLVYTPQVYTKIDPHAATKPEDHTTNNENPVLDHTAIADAKEVFISTDKNVARYQVSPNMGVRKQDITLPSFECIWSTNTTRTNGIEENNPIEPVDYELDKNVLTVYFKKTVTEGLNPEGSAYWGGTEKFRMAALKAPIAEANLTADEKKAKENGEDVCVNSEYTRIHESLLIPYLVNSKTDFTKEIGSDFAVETQTVGDETFYVHYHDSVCAYKSVANELIDVYAKYDKPLDLKTLVKVCTVERNEIQNAGSVTSHNSHEELTNYAEYGLAFRFYLATAPYITLGGVDENSNATDQQKFAEIDSPVNGIMTSKVYDINGVSATAVGREPLVRVELVDTKNNNLIAIRYIKIKWVKEVGEKIVEYTFDPVMYHCFDNIDSRFGTRQMNELIYHAAKEGGMTKQEFHSIYTEFEGTFEETGADGTAASIINREEGVESYNVVWTLSHNEVGNIWPETEKHFTKVCYYKDPTKAYPTIKLVLKRTIYMPTFGVWGYDTRYWKDNEKFDIFNVNPTVYNVTDPNPAWGETLEHMTNPTCNIYTDLLNGFLDVYGEKPFYGAGGVLYYLDKEQADKKFFYDTDHYPQPSRPTERGELGNWGYYNMGVGFYFDKEKLASGEAYVYDYFNATTGKMEKLRATTNDGGNILYINGEKAAEIINGAQNPCTFTSLNGISRNNERTYNIKLQENNPQAATDATGTRAATPTEAAKALVGKLVPIKMVATICDEKNIGCEEVTCDGEGYAGRDNTGTNHVGYHTTVIKAYDAFIIEPLEAPTLKDNYFVDAVNQGDEIQVGDVNKLQAWNFDRDGKPYYAYNGTTATEHEKALWNFYLVKEVVWKTDAIKTNLKLDNNGNLVPTAGVTDGPLPTNTEVIYDGRTETLKYHNYSGTPVNKEYIMYIPVEYGYKWKTFAKMLEVKVKVNAGTPAE